MEKLRQIVSASLRVYLDGPDTREARKQIVLDYLNSTPSARVPVSARSTASATGYGRGSASISTMRDAALNLPENDPRSLRAKARVYRAALGLILAQRRPSYYLQTDRAALDDLTDATLDRLMRRRRNFARRCTTPRKPRSAAIPARSPRRTPQPPFIEQKAVNALRTPFAHHAWASTNCTKSTGSI